MSLLTDLLPKKEDKKFFLILGVEEHRISAAIAQISENKIDILGKGESEYDEIKEEVDAADIAISEAEKSIPSQTLVEQVIFGVPISYVTEGKIKPDHLLKLKKICKELSLSPFGFIEYPQALAYYLEKKEESPPSLLLLSVGKQLLSISLIRVGKIEKNIIILLEESFIEYFEKGLENFKTEIFPSRIILYDEIGNTQRIEEIQQALTSYPWHKHSSFLHTPRIEILSRSDLTHALVDTASGSLLKQLHFSEEPVSSSASVHEPADFTKPDDEFKPGESMKSDNHMNKNENEFDFGFIKNKDITENKSLHNNEKTSAETGLKMKQQEFDFREKDESNPFKDRFESQRIKIPSVSFLPILSIFLSKINSILILVIGFIITALFIFGIIWLLPSSTVNLLVYPLINSENIDIIFTSNETSGQPNTVKVQNISEEVSGNKTIQATGKKKVGDAGKGEVVIYNKTQNQADFPKGTVLTNGNLKFTLDGDVSIASASDTGEGLTFGKVNINVTALDIGPEGNISSGNIFMIKDKPQNMFYAKNNQTFSGGTSREISCISKEDQDKLLSQLTEELTSKAKQNLQQKIEGGERILDSSIDKSISSKKFSKDVGTEGKELDLTLALKVSVLAYKNEDLTSLVRDRKSSPPEGYILDRDRSQIKINDIAQDKSGEWKGQGAMNFYYLPKIDTEKLKTEITGKSYEDISKIISKKYGISGVEIVEENSIPFFSKKLPINPHNIRIQVTPR